MGGGLGRIPPRRELEERLERLRPHPHPDIALEQYTTPVAVASEMLFTAAYLHDDIADKLVADLGCGTGRLGIGALLLGAWRVVGIDIDPEAVKVAAENAVEAGVGDRCLWVVGDVSLLRGSFDTVVMNPPFGSRRRHADARFLSEALRLAGCVYSLHKSSTRPFVVDLIGRMGGVVTLLLEMELEIPWMFSFHEKRRRPVSVDLYRIVGQQRVYKKGGAKP